MKKNISLLVSSLALFGFIQTANAQMVTPSGHVLKHQPVPSFAPVHVPPAVITHQTNHDLGTFVKPSTPPMPVAPLHVPTGAGNPNPPPSHRPVPPAPVVAPIKR